VWPAGFGPSVHEPVGGVMSIQCLIALAFGSDAPSSTPFRFVSANAMMVSSPTGASGPV
jgi:hypothetical protein